MPRNPFVLSIVAIALLLRLTVLPLALKDGRYLDYDSLEYEALATNMLHAGTFSKGTDFAGRFSEGEAFGDTVLGELVQRTTGDNQGVLVSDIAAYPLLSDGPTYFMAAPVLDKRGKQAGMGQLGHATDSGRSDDGRQT